MILIDKNETAAAKDDIHEQKLLKYFGISGACLIGLLTIISWWYPTIDLPLRIGILTAGSFGSTFILSRKELKFRTTWIVLVIGAIIHFIVVWALRDYLVTANMWVVGVCALIEGLLLQVVIQICQPSTKT